MSTQGVQRRVALGVQAAAVAALFAIPQVASAQQFSLYLSCKGKLQAANQQKGARLDLALRDNNQTALVQRSDVLPVGERLKYEVSPMLYSMKMGFLNRGAAFYDWWRGTLIVWNPNLERLTEVRLSIDRQSGGLEGEMLDGKGASLGQLRMTCEPRSQEDAPAPKF